MHRQRARLYLHLVISPPATDSAPLLVILLCTSAHLPPPDFSPFLRPLLLLRQFSLPEIRKIINSGRWGGSKRTDCHFWFVQFTKTMKLHKNAQNSCTQKMEPKMHKKRKMGDKTADKYQKKNFRLVSWKKKQRGKRSTGHFPQKKTQKNTAISGSVCTGKSSHRARSLNVASIR